MKKISLLFVMASLVIACGTSSTENISIIDITDFDTTMIEVDMLYADTTEVDTTCCP
jgi:hypothetical protein